MDKMFWAAAVVAAFLLLLSILDCPSKVYYELFSHTFNAIGVFTLSASFFLVFSSSKCATCTAGVLAG